MTDFERHDANGSENIRTIERLLDRMKEAVEAQDPVRVASCYSEHAISLFTGKVSTVRGRRRIEDTWRRHLARWTSVSLTRRDTYIRIRGGVAWGTFMWDGDGLVEDQKYRVEGERWTVVCVCENDTWQFTQTHTSLPYLDWESLRTDT